MKPTVNRRQWGLLGISIVLLGCALAGRWWPFPVTPDPLSDLQREKARLADYGDAVLIALRNEAASARTEVPPLRLPAGWQEEIRADGVAWVCTDPPSWRELVELVARIEADQPILSLDIRSGGDRRSRRITRADITVAGAPGTTRRQAGATFPGAAGPAGPRPIGRAPALRVRPPVPEGCAARLRLPVRSVSARPDPSGRDRLPTTQNRIQRQPLPL